MVVNILELEMGTLGYQQLVNIIFSSVQFSVRLCSKTATPVAENLNIYPWILGGGNGNSLQYSCRDNPMYRGA